MLYFLKTVKFFVLDIIVSIALKLRGVKVIEANKKEEKEEVYRLRYEIYKESGYIDPENFPDGKMRDKDDKHSVSFLALRKGKPIGTARLIWGNKKEDFPVFRMWNVDFDKFSLPFREMSEISKLGVKKTERKKSWVWWKMMQKKYKKSKQLGFNYWVFFSPFPIKDKINRKFKTPVYPLPLLEDTQDNLKERSSMKGYFENHNPSPYFLKSEEIYTL